MGFAPTTLPTGQRSLEEIFAVSNVLNEPEDFVKGKIHILTNKIRKEGQTGQFYFYRTNILVQNLIKLSLTNQQEEIRLSNFIGPIFWSKI